MSDPKSPPSPPAALPPIEAELVPKPPPPARPEIVIEQDPPRAPISLTSTPDPVRSNTAPVPTPPGYAPSPGYAPATDYAPAADHTSSARSGPISAPLSLETSVPPVLSAAAVTTMSGRFTTSVSGLQLKSGAAAWATSGTQRAELRVDVDGPHALDRVSGSVPMRDGFGRITRIDFTGELVDLGQSAWAGKTWRWYGAENLGIAAGDTLYCALAEGRCIAFFTAGNKQTQYLDLTRASTFFRDLTLEVDVQENVAFQPTYDTTTCVDRPADGPAEILDLPKAWARAGIGIKLANPGTKVKGSGKVGGLSSVAWSNMELHDAMNAVWGAKPAGGAAGWSLWLFVGDLHERGSSLGGIMFDSDLAPERQGAAVFTNAGMHRHGIGGMWVTPAQAQRQLFFNLMHEAGHAFNLAHSWEKALGGTWRPETARPSSRSWMNYPFNISNFYKDFYFNFDREELTFLRHAPDRLVMMGGAQWGESHGSEGDLGLRLTVAERPEGYDYLEPVYLDVRLQNSGVLTVPVPTEFDLARGTIQATVTGPSGTRSVGGYTHYSMREEAQALEPGAGIDFGIYVGAMPGVGSLFSEPGTYTVELNVVIDDTVLARSGPIPVVVNEPETFGAWRRRSAALSPEPSRVIAFQGSHYLTRSRDGLEALKAEIAAGSNTSRHLALTLGNPYAKPRRVRTGEEFATVDQDVGKAVAGYEEFLATEDSERAATAMGSGQAVYASVIDRYAELLATTGETERLRSASEVMARAASTTTGSFGSGAVADAILRAQARIP